MQNKIVAAGNAMHCVYALEDLPDPCCASLFLAGPTPHDNATPSWRPEAVQLLTGLGYTGAVIIPEPRDRWQHSRSDQVEWEAAMRARADLIAFWVPRDLITMPGFTSNVEFGEDYDSCRCLYGRPPNAPKCIYLDIRWKTVTDRAPHESLSDLLRESTAVLAEGAERHGVERDVPLLVWRSPAFAEWYKALVAAGHKLTSFQLRHALPAGERYPSRPLFGFIAWAAVAVAGEDRVKANEVFVARPDTAAVVPIYNPGGAGAEAFLVHEYRLPVRNPSGFVLEVPGGSSKEVNLAPHAIAVGELAEELGLMVDPARLVSIGSRQSAPTLASHHTHLFALSLSADEMIQLCYLADNGVMLGADSEERIRVVRQPLTGPFDASLDWASLGMLAAAARALSK